MYAILNGKGSLTGCRTYGYSLVSVHFNSQSDIVACLFRSLFVILQLSSGGEVEDYITCELIGMVTADQEQEFHKPNSWTTCETFAVAWIFNIIGALTILTTLDKFLGFEYWIEKRSSRGCYWYICSLLVLKVWWENVLYASYTWEVMRGKLREGMHRETRTNSTF